MGRGIGADKIISNRKFLPIRRKTIYDKITSLRKNLTIRDRDAIKINTIYKNSLDKETTL